FLEYFSDQVERMTKVLYKDQREGNLLQLNAEDFINLIERKDSKLQGFFNILYNAMNPKEKSVKTQNFLKQKIMIFCYQMAGLRNKQVSSAKTALGLFLAKSGASAHCVNTMANMGL
ncbi:18256_t:CDS:1, partial [Cetraspora pellucida]